MRYRDAPSVEVSELIRGVTAEDAWAVVTDIELPTHTDGELVSVDWVGSPAEVVVGARFRGTNSADGLGTWTAECVITEVEPPRRWTWTAGGPTGEPWATWAFEIDRASEGVIVRQWARLGPGPSRLSQVIESKPDLEGRIIARRMSDWRRGMQANLDWVRVRLES